MRGRRLRRRGEHQRHPLDLDLQRATCDRLGIYAQDFEGACPDGWALAGEFQCGVPTHGPGAAHSGTQSLGMDMSTGLYSNNIGWGTTTATSPAISLTATSTPKFHVWMWIQSEGSSFDGTNLQVSTDGVNFTELSSVTPAYTLTIAGEQAWGGQINAWDEYVADLSAYAGQTVYLRVDFHSDGSDTFAGIYVDDALVTAQ